MDLKKSDVEVFFCPCLAEVSPFELPRAAIGIRQTKAAASPAIAIPGPSLMTIEGL
jgi:hypothetical protein